MDINEAVQKFLEGFCERVYPVMLSFNREAMRYEGVVPAITYEFVNASTLATHSGSTGSRKVELEINLWGMMADIVPIRDGISAALNGRVTRLSGFEFAVIEKRVQDIFEPNVVFRRILMRYEGVVIG